MNSDTKLNVTVTILCAIFVAAASIASAWIARQTITQYDWREVPCFSADETMKYFPLKKGNEWQYEGKVETWNKEGQPIESAISLTMKVVAEVTGNSATLFIMQGHPSDSTQVTRDLIGNRAKCDVIPSHYGFLTLGNKIFHIHGDQLDLVRKEIETRHESLFGVLTSEEIEYEFPLFKGARFGDLKQIGRSDLSYFRYVNDAIVFHKPSDRRIKEVPEYEITQNHLPDNSTEYFIPYLGIASYMYSHHGTKMETSLSLKHYELRDADE